MEMEEFRLHTIGMLIDLIRYREDLRKRDHELPQARNLHFQANLNRNPDKHPEPFLIEDVAPYLFDKTDEEREAENVDRMVNKAELMCMNQSLRPPDPNKERKRMTKPKPTAPAPNLTVN